MWMRNERNDETVIEEKKNQNNEQIALENMEQWQMEGTRREEWLTARGGEERRREGEMSVCVDE